MDMKEMVDRIDINAPMNRRLRKLVQFRDMSDKQFEAMLIEKASKPTSPEEIFETEIENKLKEFSEDYDLTDMKINDRMSLRSLVQLTLTLENYEQRLFEYRQDSESNFENIQNVKVLAEIMNKLRGDISKIQADLNITRKVRKSDKDVSVIAFIDDLKKKARANYKAKMKYIFCPRCDMLLGTVWTLYNSKAKFNFVCQRSLEDGKVCGKKVSVTVEELDSKGGTNQPDLMPEAMK